MEQTKDQSKYMAGNKKKRSTLRKLLFCAVVLFVVIIGVFVALIACNNISMWSDETFENRLDEALRRSENWVEGSRLDILADKNAALMTMLRECNDVRPNPVFNGIVRSFLNRSASGYSRSWNREVDPNWPVDKRELNLAIANDNLDNKWALYAIAPEKAEIDHDDLGMFDYEKWHRRQLTHQLFALTMLRDRYEPSKRLDDLIEHLCQRTGGDLNLNIPVVDIYIQRVAFVLRAGHPQKIRRRWVERIIANQQPDGGWNDRWFCFTTIRRKPIFSISRTPSDAHATVQAVLALYLVKYRYPEHFGLK
ncbi:MAG: hypothetical protein JW749_04990 [Sedimentisphaerales bacterium]|nr:hypothetical protein [Sedimentisphaerales bacterium]